MIIKCRDFLDMEIEIKSQQKSIVMFGAGAIGTTTTLAILKDYSLLNYISCYIDNDSRLWGRKIHTIYEKYEIKSPDHLKNCDPNKMVILLNISRYTEVIEQLEQMAYTKEMTCYIMPMMCIHNFEQNGKQGVIKKYSQPVIPKVIHYMWLGGKALPDNLQKCVDSWKRYCPDYEIRCWNESNYDIEKNIYMKQAYENGAYGFVPDYARLDILYTYGGIYMDTDVELKRNLDDLLYQDAFCGVEKWQVLNFGGCSGSVAHHKAIKTFLETREKIAFVNDDGTLNRHTCACIDTKVAHKNGYKVNGKNQEILGMMVYTSDYFHPYDYMSGKCEMTDDTFSVHHFNGGWLTERERLANKKVSEQYDIMYQTLISQKK